MMALIISLAAAAHQPAVAQPQEEPQVQQEEQGVEVRGKRRLCKRIAVGSAETRLKRENVCLTSREWDLAREQSVEFLEDLARRNPRGAKTSSGREAGSSSGR